MYTPRYKRVVQTHSITPRRSVNQSSERQHVSFEDKRTSALQQQQFIEGIHASSDTAKAETPISGKVIQRYTILEPGAYQKGGNEQENMFPSNQLDDSITRTREEDGSKSFVKNLKWVQQFSNNPPLKVSQKGLLALESTVGQPRVFYGDSGMVQQFSQRLTNIGSRITLQEAPGATVTTPKKPTNPDGETQELVRVIPVRNSHIPNTEDLMNTCVCSDVSEKIVGGKKLVMGNKVGNQKVLDTASKNTISGLGRILSKQGENSTPNDFAHAWENDEGVTNVHDQNLPIKQHISKFFAHDFFTRKHLMPGNQVLRALSVDGIPKILWEQVFELYVDKLEDQRPNELAILDHIKSYLMIQGTIAYRKTKSQNMNSRLGINEMAAPEVGESFSSFGLPSLITTDHYGVPGHVVDLVSSTQNKFQMILNDFLEVKERAEKLGRLVKSEYEKAKGLVQYAEHHAAVVAKDGPDTVSFENYNRRGESDTLLEELWSTWFKEKDEFHYAINEQVRLMLKEVRLANENKHDTSQSFMVLKSKKQALKQFQEDFVFINDRTRFKLDTDIEEKRDDLWHFNMYGPAEQSFHDVWSKSIPNTVTVRTTGLMDPQMSDILRKKVSHILYQKAATDGFNKPLSDYNTLKIGLLQMIEVPQKRIEYSDLLQYLKSMEEENGVLGEAEQQEAERLFGDPVID